MKRARTRVVPIILAMFVGLLLLPLQGRAARAVEPCAAAATACTRHGALGCVARQRIEPRRDAVEDADDAAPSRSLGAFEPLAAVLMVFAAPAIPRSSVRCERPRARAPP